MDILNRLPSSSITLSNGILAFTAGTREAWKESKTDEYLNTWWTGHPDQTNLAVNFGHNWGLGESFRCSIPTFCEAPLCNALLPQDNNTINGCMILESFQNLNHFIVKLRDALWLSNNQYSTLQVASGKTLSPAANRRNWQP